MNLGRGTEKKEQHSFRFIFLQAFNGYMEGYVGQLNLKTSRKEKKWSENLSLTSKPMLLTLAHFNQLNKLF